MESVNVRVVKLDRPPQYVSPAEAPDDDARALTWNGTECVLQLHLHEDAAGAEYVTFDLSAQNLPSAPRRMKMFATFGRVNYRMNPPLNRLLEVWDDQTPDVPVLHLPRDGPHAPLLFRFSEQTEYEKFICFVRDRVCDLTKKWWKQHYDDFSAPRSPRRAQSSEDADNKRRRQSTPGPPLHRQPLSPAVSFCVF